MRARGLERASRSGRQFSSRRPRSSATTTRCGIRFSLRGTSQEALAHELEYDRTYLAGIERGERNLSLDTLSKLTEQLGVDPLDLLTAAD